MTQASLDQSNCFALNMESDDAPGIEQGSIKHCDQAGKCENQRRLTSDENSEAAAEAPEIQLANEQPPSYNEVNQFRENSETVPAPEYQPDEGQPPSYNEVSQLRELNAAYLTELHRGNPLPYNEFQGQTDPSHVTEPVQGQTEATPGLQVLFVICETTVIRKREPIGNIFLCEIVMSCITTWCFCFIFGIIAFFFAVSARSDFQGGSIESAVRESRRSRAFSITGIVIGIVMIISMAPFVSVPK